MRTFIIWILAIFLTVFWGSVSLISSLFDKTGNTGFNCMRRWARGLLKISSVKFHVEGFEKLIPDQNYLFISNHQSQVDIIALCASLPIKFRWMAKKELFKIPFLGWHMRRMRYVPIERESVSSSMTGLVLASKALKEGDSLVIFPEGSRSKDGKLKPFKNGAFYLAIDAGVPLVPVTINGTADIMKKGSLEINPGEVRIVASDIIKVDNFTQSDRDKLKELVRGNIASKLL